MTLFEIISNPGNHFYIDDKKYISFTTNEKITFLNSIANILTLDSENYEDKYVLEEQIEVIIRESLFLQASLS